MGRRLWSYTHLGNEEMYRDVLYETLCFRTGSYLLWQWLGTIHLHCKPRLQQENLAVLWGMFLQAYPPSDRRGHAPATQGRTNASFTTVYTERPASTGYNPQRDLRTQHHRRHRRILVGDSRRLQDTPAVAYWALQRSQRSKLNWWRSSKAN